MQLLLYTKQNVLTLHLKSAVRHEYIMGIKELKAFSMNSSLCHICCLLCIASCVIACCVHHSFSIVMLSCCHHSYHGHRKLLIGLQMSLLKVYCEVGRAASSRNVFQMCFSFYDLLNVKWHRIFYVMAPSLNYSNLQYPYASTTAAMEKKPVRGTN